MTNSLPEMLPPEWMWSSHPLLDDLAFVRADRDVVSDAWIAFLQPLLSRHGVRLSASTVRGDIVEVVRNLQPLSMPTRERYLVVPCHNGWSLILDNGSSGSDTDSLLAGCVMQSRKRGVRLCLSAPVDPETTMQRVLSVIWEITDPCGETDKDTVRSLAVHKEGGWHWTNIGEPLPFEDVAAYSAKRIGDRFTPQMLVKYAHEMGIDAFSKAFYRSRELGATLIQLSHVPFPNQKQKTLADVQKNWQWYDK